MHVTKRKKTYRHLGFQMSEMLVPDLDDPLAYFRSMRDVGVLEFRP
jgi:hypothetical protein